MMEKLCAKTNGQPTILMYDVACMLKRHLLVSGPGEQKYQLTDFDVIGSM